MRKFLLAVLFLAGTAGAALNLMTWDGSASSDFNDTANWTGNCAAGTTLSAGDSCLMNSGAIAATASAAVSIGYLLTTSGYSGNLSFAGQTFAVATGFSLAHTGTMTFGNFTMTGTGKCTIGAIGTMTSLVSLTFNGTDTLNNNKGTFTFTTLTLGNGASLFSINKNMLSLSNNPITLGTNSRLILGTNCGLFLRNYASTSNWSLASGASIVDTGGFTVSSFANSVIDTLPALTCTGNGTITLNTSSAAVTGIKHVFTGTWNTTNDILSFCDYAGASKTTYINGQTITCNAFKNGANNATASQTFVLDGGVLNCTSFDLSTYNTGTSIDSMQTGTINCSGPCTIGANHAFVQGTLVFVIDSTGPVTSAGKSFYDFKVNSSGATTVTLADVFNATDSLVLTDGKTIASDTVHAAQLAINSADSSMFAKPLLVTGNALFNGGYYIPALFTGVGGDIDVTAGYNHFQRDSCGGDLTVTSTDTTWFDSGDTSFVGGNLTIGATAKLKVTGHVFKFLDGVTHTITVNGVSMTGSKFVGKNLTFVGSISCIPIISDSGTVTIGAGTTLTAGAGYDLQGSVGKPVILRSGTPGTRATLTLPATAIFGYADFKDINSTLTIFADITCKNSGNNINIQFAGASAQSKNKFGFKGGRKWHF